MKRLVRFCLLIYVLIVSSTVVFAEKFGDFEYETIGSTVQLTSYLGGGGRVTIPSRVKGQPVTSIRGKFMRNDAGVTHLTIPSSVRDIGYLAFASCDVLESITVDEGNRAYSSLDGALFNKSGSSLIQCPPARSGTYRIPAGVTRLDPGFFDCENLTGVIFSESVVSLHSVTFNLCAELTTFEVEEGNNQFSSRKGVLYNQSQTELIRCPPSLSGSYDVPEGVVSLDQRAFFSCDSVTEVTLPASLTSIGSYAFSGCGRLVNVSLPENLVMIDDYAFSKNRQITTVTFPATLQSIGRRAFYGCSSLSRAEFLGDAPTTLGEDTFERASSGFSIYYNNRNTGFTQPSWAGYPCEPDRGLLGMKSDYLVQGMGSARSSSSSSARTQKSSGSTSSSRSSSSSSSKQRSSRSSNTTTSGVSVAEILDEAFFAEQGGRADLDDLKETPEKYLGAVVKLGFERAYSRSTSISSGTITVYSNDYRLSVSLLLPSTDEAWEWRMDVQDSGSSGSVYVYIDESGFYALGTRRKKSGAGYTYTF